MFGAWSIDSSEVCERPGNAQHAVDASRRQSALISCSTHRTQHLGGDGPAPTQHRARHVTVDHPFGAGKPLTCANAGGLDPFAHDR
jgi:hypothetical protein